PPAPRACGRRAGRDDRRRHPRAGGRPGDLLPGRGVRAREPPRDPRGHGGPRCLRGLVPGARAPHAAGPGSGAQGGLVNAIRDVFVENGDKIAEALLETGYMVIVAIIAAVLVGLPLGTLIYLTRTGGPLENRLVWGLADLYVTIVRSFPF